VISIGEDPYPTRNCLLTQHQQISLNIIRRNLINTFRQLSKARDGSNDPAQMQLPLRTRLGDVEEETIHRATDVPGMLFYYLFDDWLNTYSLIARREHRYARELNTLRIQMMNRAILEHIEKLHHIGRQLGVLKRVYQSYEMIIDRVLERQEPTLASLKNSKIAMNTGGLQSMDDSTANIMRPPPALLTPAHLDESQLLGVSLSSAARARFERLKHRIRLYALSEINECLDQKESLVMMNFNLIAIKEAFSVERLTEVTLLLAKITIMFMPVSLLSAYFGVEFVDADFTVASYWKWFSGIFVASGVALIVFSAVSGTSKTKVLYKPLGTKIREKITTLMERKTGKKDVDDEENVY
jgi:Mg2+ and Co2+ transporter CorA